MASRRVKRVLGVLLLLLVGLIGAAVVWGWSAWRKTPEYWQVIDAPPVSPRRAELAQRAERFEYWVVERFGQVREDAGLWQIELDQQEINLWLATRLPQWLANQKIQMPDWLHDPMVVVQSGRVIVAAQMRTEALDKVVSLEYEPRTGESGVVELGLQQVRGGNLPLPYEQVMDAAQSQIDSENQQRVAEFNLLRDKLRAVPLRRELDDGRTIEVLEVRAEPGKLTLTCRTLLRR